MPKTIVVTGGSGRAGAFVVKELLEHGYAVINLDLAEPAESPCPFRAVDLTDYQAVKAAMQGADAVVHFASNPEPDFDFDTGADRFSNNTMCTYNVFNAACALNLEKVVWASSETVLGFPFEKCLPVSVPVDESHASIPQNSYGLSKVACELLGDHMNRLYGIPFIGLRLSNVLVTDPDHEASYSLIPGYWNDLASRKFNLWAYIDARDSARAARLALESNIKGSENFIIAAADTIMRQSNRELLGAVMPEVPVEGGLGDHQSLLNCDKAARLLGWRPRHCWRDVLGAD